MPLKSIGDAVPAKVETSTTSAAPRTFSAISATTASVRSSEVPSGRSTTTCSSFLLSKGSIFTATVLVKKRASEINRIATVPKMKV